MQTKYALALLETPRYGRVSATRVAERTGFDVSDAYELHEHILELKAENGRLPVPTLEELRRAVGIAEDIVYRSEAADIAIVSRFEPGYPRRLLDLEDAPLLIHVKGDRAALTGELAIAVIGTREPSATGERLGRRLTEVFVDSGFDIVSGLAKGCDTIAHQTCLEKGGRTVAVLANGLDKIYPAPNTGLAERILESGGVLLTEYPIGRKLKPSYLVERDRLQSGLADAICVIETDVKGGTMHTVGFAKRQKRFIGCLLHPPANQGEPKSRGNRQLIADGVGHPLSNPEDIARFVSLVKGPPPGGSGPAESRAAAGQGTQLNLL